jgi:hypothetical protein
LMSQELLNISDFLHQFQGTRPHTIWKHNLSQLIYSLRNIFRFQSEKGILFYTVPLYDKQNGSNLSGQVLIAG